MDKQKIVNFLEDNGISEIKEINYDNEVILLKFFFDFDEEEIEAAKAYANDECEEEAESDSWYKDFFLPYLNELATDTVGDIIEDSMEELNIEAQFVSYEVSKDDYSYNEFTAVFYENGKDVDLNKILDRIED